MFDIKYGLMFLAYNICFAIIFKMLIKLGIKVPKVLECKDELLWGHLILRDVACSDWFTNNRACITIGNGFNHYHSSSSDK